MDIILWFNLVLNLKKLINRLREHENKMFSFETKICKSFCELEQISSKANETKN